MSVHSSEVKVYVRTRPTAAFAQDLIEYLPDKQTVNVHQRKDSRKGVVNNQLSSWSFRLDGVLHDTSQEEVYECVAQEVVLGALGGYNGTVMCFGQTGAGKTYTITGATESYKQRGLIPRALQEVFQEVEYRTSQAFSVHLSFLEIYNETFIDLLSSVRGSGKPQGGSLAVVEEAGGGVSVRGLFLHRVHNEEEALNLLFEGEMNRIIGAHALNKNSSRSHCIFTIHIESRSRTLSDAKFVTSKLNLVDLAGSERLGKTGSEGQVLKEAMYINKSLSFLEQTILALADHRREHVPFRQSKLTHALKDSLGGNCNTVLVANIYGEAAQIEETLSTLRFASRMKCVRTEPSINEHMDPVLQVRRLQKEIQLLRQELSIHDTLSNRTGVSYEPLSEAQVAEVKSQVQRYLEGSLDEIAVVSIRQIQEVFAQFKGIIQGLEQQVTEQVPQSHTTVQRTPTSPVTQPQEVKSVVGEVEDRGFGQGSVAPSVRHIHQASPTRSKARRARDISRREEAEGPVMQTQAEAPSPGGHREQQDPRPEASEPQRTASRPASPPPKMAAFEDFKAERGSEINRILKENKAVLVERKARLRTLREAVNAVKQEIDHTASAVRPYQEQRVNQGQFVSVDGEAVLEEAELCLVLHLRELKARYRTQHTELVNTRAEVSYCQHLVDQCRVRLLAEFESWYKESFLLPEEVQSILRAGGPIPPGMVPVESALALEDEEQGRFERLRKELMADSPSAVSFYNAHHRALHRRGSRQMAQSPGSQRSSMGGGAGKLKLPAILSVT